MRNLLPIATLLTGLILSTAASASDPVYKWTDSSGHSHYSQTPPSGQKYQTITPAGTTTDNPALTTAAGPKPDNGKTPESVKAAATVPVTSDPAQIEATRQRLCNASRANLEVLSKRAVISMDLDGKGKPQPLSAEQKSEQQQKAQQQVGVYCKK